jgi:hypothetical protein
MVSYVPFAGIGAVVVTVLMVATMLYLVWGSLDGDAHTPSPDNDPEEPELAEGSESDETQGELTAEGDTA